MRNAIKMHICNGSTSNNVVVTHISNNKYSYLSPNGSQHTYLVFKSYKAYKIEIIGIPHKLFTSNSFYIAEIKSSSCVPIDIN